MLKTVKRQQYSYWIGGREEEKVNKQKKGEHTKERMATPWHHESQPTWQKAAATVCETVISFTGQKLCSIYTETHNWIQTLRTEIIWWTFNSAKVSRALERHPYWSHVSSTECCQLLNLSLASFKAPATMLTDFSFWVFKTACYSSN